MRSVKKGWLTFFDYLNRIFNLMLIKGHKVDFLCPKKCLVLLLAIISRVFQLILAKLLILLCVCVLIIIRQDAPLGFLLHS